VQALVATDVAARGIHVDDVGCVVHFDPPADAKDYTHRSGRTGRAGAEGVVVSFVTEGEAEKAKARQLQRALGMAVPAEPRRPSGAPNGRPGSGRPNRNRNGGGYKGGYRGKRRG
jgi:superfamily II DNA/RNA helicase